MKVYHLEFAKLGKTISGGENCMIENIKYFASKKIKNIILTTDNGKKSYEKLGIKENKYIRYKTIKTYDFEKKSHPFISYLQRTPKAVKLIKQLKPRDKDTIICHNDFFPNSIPCYHLAKKNKETKVIYWEHMIAPSLFRGYEGEFTGKFNIPGPRLINYRLNQILYRKIAPARAIILTHNPYYKEILKRKYPNNRIHVLKKYAGIENPPISKKKIYDIAWMGRFHKQKGLLEVIEILKKIKKEMPKANLLIIGDGEKDIKKDFFKKVEEENLSKNIKYVGFVSGEKKLELLSKAKIFLMTSYFESYGQVNIEAMQLGLPVVMYDLPVYGFIKSGAIRVPIKDNKAMAKESLSLLKNKRLYDKTRKQAIEFSSDFSWKATGKELYELIKS